MEETEEKGKRNTDEIAKPIKIMRNKGNNNQ